MGLMLSDFKPRPELRVKETAIDRAAVPVIEAHNHAKFWVRTGRPIEDLLRLMDEVNIERLVNLAGQGEDPFISHQQTEAKYPDRFATIGAPDISGPDDPDFAKRVTAQMRRMRDSGFRGFKIWKTLGLRIRDSRGALVRPDDERLLPVFRAAAEMGLPVYMHLGDPAAFFKPLDEFNERYEELQAHPDWHFYGGDLPSFQEVLDAQERVLARETDITFILAHTAGCAEDLGYVGGLLDKYPHVNLDISARFAELGRQPYTAREFFLRYEDRILFGLDSTPHSGDYKLAFRFLETMDEYFPYDTDVPPKQGRWHIYGIGLPQATLAKVYRDNALRLLSI